MKNRKWVWLDMDGTFVDLYGVNGWLEDLRAYKTRPYEVAQCLYNVYELFEALASLKEKGYNIGVISWSCKNSNKAYDREVENAKREWLYMNCLDLVLDKVLVTPYGTRKADTCRAYGYGVLVDDEENNRNEWDLGDTINANENILEKLRALV